MPMTQPYPQTEPVHSQDYSKVDSEGGGGSDWASLLFFLSFFFLTLHLRVIKMQRNMPL